MVDSGSAACFISEKAANRLGYFIFQVSMADPPHKSNIIGEVVIDIAVNSKEYVGQVVNVIQKLFIGLTILMALKSL